MCELMHRRVLFERLAAAKTPLGDGLLCVLTVQTSSYLTSRPIIWTWKPLRPWEML